MTSTLCQSAALIRIVAIWLVKIAEFFGIIINGVLSMVEIVGKILHELGGFLPEIRVAIDCLGRPRLSFTTLQMVSRHLPVRKSVLREKIQNSHSRQMEFSL